MANSNEYMNEYMKRRYKTRRETAITMLGGICKSCGSAENLELDHINPKDKSFNLSKIWSCAEWKFHLELDKCQLLCKPCHKEKSDDEKRIKHGTGKSGKRNCRCTPCKKRKASYMKEYQKTYIRGL